MNKITLIDGGLATELERMGFVLDGDLWSAELLLTAPDAIKQVYAAYLTAGSDIISTMTYQATFAGLAKIGLEHDRAADLFRYAVQLAAEAITESGRTAHIAASIGSYGAYLADGSEYVGDYALSVAELYDFHAERWHVLANSTADLMAIEALPSYREAQALVQLVNATQKPAWFSFTVRDEAHISDGTPLADCARMLDTVESVVAIGVNCCRPSVIPGVIDQLKSATTKPIIVYPNSGELWDATNKCWLAGTQQTVEEYARAAATWLTMGATYIGGCCRTTPEHIGRLRVIREERE